MKVKFEAEFQSEVDSILIKVTYKNGIINSTEINNDEDKNPLSNSIIKKPLKTSIKLPSDPEIPPDPEFSNIKV